MQRYLTSLRTDIFIISLVILVSPLWCDRERHVFGRKPKPVTCLTPQHIRARFSEGGLNDPLVPWWDRRIDPGGCPRRASASGLPDFEFRWIECDDIGPSGHE